MNESHPSLIAFLPSIVAAYVSVFLVSLPYNDPNIPDPRCAELAATIERAESANPNAGFSASYIGELLTAIGEYRANCRHEANERD